jgi:putative nucleotidyltransferase with HDIG domain
MKRENYIRGIWLTTLLLVSAGMALYWALVAEPKPEVVTGDVITETLLVATITIWLWVLLGREDGLARATAPLVLGVSLFLLGGVSDVLDEFFRLPEFVKSYFENGLILAGTSLIAIGLTRWVSHSRREAAAITRRNSELAALNATAATVSQSLELDRVLNDALDEVLKLEVFKAQAGAKVFLLDEQRTTLSLAAHRRVPADHPCLQNPIKVGECLCGLAVEQGQVVISADAREDERHSRRWPDMPPHKDVCVPLKARGRVLGVLNVQVSAEWDVADTEIALLTAIGNQIGVAIENAQLYEKMKAQSERISALYRIDQALISSIDLNQTLQVVLEEISAAIGVNRCTLWLLDENGQAATGVAELQPETERVTSIIGMKLWASDQPLLEKILSEGQPIVVNDVHNPAWAHWIKKEHIESFRLKSLLIVPLESNGQRRGLIILDDTRERHFFTPDEVALVVSAARQASIAIESARLFEETKQRLQELAMLYQVGVGIIGTLDLDHVLQLTIESAIQAIPAAEKGSLFLIDEENDELVIRAGHGYGPEVVERVRLKLGEGHIDWVVKEKQPMVIANFQTDPRLKPFPDLEEVTAIKSAVVVPLEVKGKVIGALALDNVTSYGAFSESDVQLLSTFASQAAIAIENARLFEQAQQEIAQRKRAEEQIQRQLQRLAALHDVDMAITSSLDLHVSLNVLLDQATTQLRVDAADVLLLNPHTQTLEYAAGRGFRSRGIERSHVRLGEGHAGQAVLERRIIHIPNLAETGTNFVRAKLLANEDFITYYAVPLIAKGQVKGVLEIFHRALLGSDPEWLGFLETLAGQAAIAIDNAWLFEGLQRSNVELALAYDTTLEGWSRALDLRDEETEGHTQRVTELTLRLARAMGVSDEELVHVRRGALLHDIGKMGIPDSILHKPGPPTDDEWEIIRQHPVYAYEMISPIVYLRPALDIPYCHHEKWDGTGYPRGLKGEQIPLAARIFAVVDVYDALRSDRPYRPAWSEEEVRQYIRQEAGHHFDPQVVEMFMRLLEPSTS